MLKLKNNYSIKATKTAFILVKATGKVTKEGLPILQSKGSYPSLSRALEGYVNHVSQDNIMEYDINLSGIKRILNELKDEISLYGVSDSILKKADSDKSVVVDDGEDSQED